MGKCHEARLSVGKALRRSRASGGWQREAFCPRLSQKHGERACCTSERSRRRDGK